MSMLRAFPGMTVRDVVCEMNLINLWAVGEHLRMLESAAEAEAERLNPALGGAR